MKKKLIITLAFALSSALLADAKKGMDIAKEADKRDNGFGDSKVEMVMTLKNRQGQKSTRYIKTKTLEVRGDGDKSITVFVKPRDVKGTALLTYSHPTGDDDQWLYLPALKRIKRISSSNKSGPFMGSEFAFEDIGSQEVDEYSYKYLKTEPCSLGQCFVVEQKPNYKGSGYKKRIAWYGTKEYRLAKIDYFDRKKSKLKTLTYSEYKKYVGKYWRAHKLHMVNHQNGKSTELVFKNYKFQNGFSQAHFSRNSLKRAR